MQGHDGVVTEGLRDAIAVERGGGESACINTVRNKPHAPLVFQAMKQVKDRATVLVFAVEVAGFPDGEQGSRLGVLGEGNQRVHSILN